MPCLTGTTVLCTGFPDQTRQELQRLVNILGGSYLTDCSRGAAPDVMVAQSVLSSKYKATVAAQADVPIVTSDWLRVCHQADIKASFEEHRLAVFAGLEICISGYVKRKAQMGAFINKLGGVYNAELNKATCHVLVCEVPSGQKYKVARIWGKEIVSDKWLQASAAAGHCMETAPYDLEPGLYGKRLESRVPPGPTPVLASDFQPIPQQATQKQQATAAALQQQPKPTTVAALQQQTKPTTAAALQHQPKPTTATVPLPQAKQSIVSGAAVPQQHLQQHEAGCGSDVAARETKTASGSQHRDDKVQPASTAPAATDVSRAVAANRPDDQDCLFLSGVRLHLCCCNPKEQLELVRIAREGCALRHTDLSPGLTHIVVGSDPTGAEIQAVKDYVQEHRAEVKIVQADWLRQCGEERSLLTASSGYLLPLSSLTAPPARLSPHKLDAHQRGSAGTAQGGQGGDSGFAQTAHGATGKGEEGEEPGAAVGSQPPKHQALKGFWFTLAALENSDKAEAQRAQALVWRYGGRRFTSQTLHLLQGVDKSSVLALCPCSLPKHKVAQLQCWGDFTSVPEKQRVSMLWLEWVVQSGRMIPFQPRGSVACRPFPFTLPLPGMSDIRVTVSSYPEDVKITISHLVTIMGGKYTTSMGKRNSHLLIRAAAGPKFAGCASRGVIPVTADWLIESAHAGRLLDERDFHPPALADGDSDAGFSQMPLDTQMATQAGTQANLLTRFGAVEPAPRRGPAGGSQVPGRPMSLLQKVAQDAKRRTLTASQGGGLGLARELSQAHSNAPAGALQPMRPPLPPEQPVAAPAGPSLLDTILEGVQPGSCHRPTCASGPTTSEGIASSLKQAQDAVSTPGSAAAPPSAKGRAKAATPARDSSAVEGQPDGNLESALSRLGGMLESAGPVADQPCSQFEAPAEAPAQGSAPGWPQSTTSSGNASFPSGRASRPKDTSGAVDSQGTSQNSLQRAKRKAREGAAASGRGKRPSRAHEDALMSQMGCSQQVGYEGANMSTGIGPLSRLHGANHAASLDPCASHSSAEVVQSLAKAEAQSRQRLAQVAKSRQSHTVDKDDLEEMGLM